MPYRTFDLTDAAANALGATSGFALALVVLLLWIRPADPARARGARLARRDLLQHRPERRAAEDVDVEVRHLLVGRRAPVLASRR